MNKKRSADSQGVDFGVQDGHIEKYATGSQIIYPQEQN